jgi:uncharacterized protein (DUF983 family)
MAMREDDPRFPPVSPLRVGLAMRCPRCGQGKLFAGYLQLHPRCSVCGLDLTSADSADGPAFFVMSIVGFVVVGGALAVEILYQPALWVHVALWLPLAIALPLALLRPAKGLMVALQYHYRAEEGRHTSND